jgi:hypothetical protein
MLVRFPPAGLFLNHVGLLVSDDELDYWMQASVGGVAAGE